MRKTLVTSRAAVLAIAALILPNASAYCQKVEKGWANAITTCADGSALLKRSRIRISRSAGNSSLPAISLDRGTRFQDIDGFGFALTYSSCYNLLKMPKEKRMAFLRQTYSQKEGYGTSYARISIGCNDFSSTEYSLCDEPGLEHFRLYKDETEYVIPVIKEILSINPDLKIIAAPWTCPKWMKVEDLDSLKPHDEWTDGHLNPQMRDTYARYFVMFIKEMKANGISIYAVSPQNEPLNKGNCASLFMPWKEQAPFVKSLAKAFRSSGLGTKIYVFDHNYNYDRLSDQEDYPVRLYNEIGRDYEGSDLVVGAAYHDYGGTNDELEDIHAKAEDQELIFTEASIGTWNDGRNLRRHLISDMDKLCLGTINRWCRAVLVWNLMLDTKRGPNLDGGCQTCYGAVDISMDYKTIMRNSHYYIISHMSSAVKPGAVRIGTNLERMPDGIMISAFLNPDSTIALVLLNKNVKDETILIKDSGKYLQAVVKARSVKSLVWK